MAIRRALHNLFDRTDLRFDRIEVAGGTSLFQSGDRPRRLFMVREGLFAAIDPRFGARSPIGLIGRGETLGEMALMAGFAHRRNVTALRDSVVDALDAEIFLQALHSDPELTFEVAGLIARRARDGPLPLSLPRAVLVTAIDDACIAHRLAHDLAKAARALGVRAVAVDCAELNDDVRQLGNAEIANELVLVAAEADETAWADACRRRVDRVLLLGRADRPPPETCALCPSEPLQANGLVELVLERSPERLGPATAAWIAATNTRRVHHIDEMGGGVARLARLLTGTAIGLALSGGGARAFAHVGAVRALREAGMPIDAVAGSSMGAIIAAGVASGWSDDELDERMRDAFVDSNPLDDIALPIVAMTRGRKVEDRLRRHFGDARIEELPIAFFCGSTNLTTGQWDCADRGDLVDALRESVSLPGILPPVIRDGNVLVDGGLLRNLPTELMRERHAGTVIGCDVSNAMGLLPQNIAPPRSWLRWFTSGAWRRGPPLVSILIRSATISTGKEIAAARGACDLYVVPELDMIEIRDWKAYPRAVEAGYRAMATAIEQAEQPLTHLRISTERLHLAPL